MTAPLMVHASHISKKDTLSCFLCFILSFWHISRNGKNSPLFPSLIQTTSIKVFHISSQIWHCTLYPRTHNRFYHHGQTPPFEASLPNQCWCPSDRGLDDKRPSHQMCCLGTNQWSHWLRGLLFWEWTGIMHASLFHFHSCHHNRAPYWTTTQVSTARCWRPSTRHYVSSRTRSTSRLLGLPQNWISHQPSSVISSYRTSRTPWCFTTKQTSMASIKYPSHIRGTGMIWPGFLSSSHYY